MLELLDALLADFRRWRKLRGGVWVHWMMDQGGSLWLRHVGEAPRHLRHLRPPEGAHGTPLVEDWR